MRWGLIGYGRIAAKFQESINASKTNQIVAIASRSKYDKIPATYTAYDNYKDILTDPDVEIIYVSTTHNTHKQHAIAALNAGKHVLCEKPMSISAADTLDICTAASANGRFLMEAVWSRFLPGYREVIDKIKAGVIGEVELIQANFCFKMNPDEPKERLVSPDLAGGAVWDVGIYPISLAQDLYTDDPIHIQAQGVLNEHGVESRGLISLGYEGGRLAQLCCGYDISMPNHAIIVGTQGSITMEDFWKCEAYTIKTETGAEIYKVPMTSTGLYHEIEACERYISQGKTSADLMDWHHSTQLAQIMDEVIRQCRT